MSTPNGTPVVGPASAEPQDLQQRIDDDFIPGDNIALFYIFVRAFLRFHSVTNQLNRLRHDVHALVWRYCQY